MQVLNGEVGGLAQFISPKCQGVLGDLRDGKATQKQLEELKKNFSGLKRFNSMLEGSSTRVLILNNADNAIITFKVKKEGADFKVIEMTVKPAATKK